MSGWQSSLGVASVDAVHEESDLRTVNPRILPFINRDTLTPKHSKLTTMKLCCRPPSSLTAYSQASLGEKIITKADREKLIRFSTGHLRGNDRDQSGRSQFILVN